MWAGACGGCLGGGAAHEVVDIHAQGQAEVGGGSADQPGKELEDGGQSEVCTEMPQERVDQVRQDYIDPAFLVQILRTKQVRLLKAKFILEWIEGGCGPLPCRQDLPEEAFVDVDALDEQQLASLIIIAISYCWISQEHPDPDCYHLKTLGALLRCFLDSSFDSAPDEIELETAWVQKTALKTAGVHFGAGDGRCVGVFLDWTGLYQDKPKGRRTAEENEVFNNALKTINIWYAHITTIVWMLTSLPAGVQRGGYRDSGWTTFEASVANILTKGTDIMEITDEARRKLLTSDTCRLSYAQLSHDMMSRQSRLPAVPDEFNRIIDGKIFTNGADKDAVVKPKYAKTFYDLIPSSPAIQYSGLSLTPESVYKILDLTMVHIKNLETLDLSCNPDINQPIQSFAQLPSLVTLNLTITKVSGDVGALKPLVNLKYLDLSDTQVTGDVAELQALVHLEQLLLTNQPVSGDVGAMEPLVNLKHLYLHGTQVSGDVGKLRALVDLATLDLGETQVTGDLGALEALVKLTYLFLGGTQVCGDVGELRVLGDLTQLSLGKTQVGGDVGKLKALVNLKELDLNGTQVAGDVSELEALVDLTALQLEGTQVTGDVSALQALVDLRCLELNKTQVGGDVGALQPLVKLKVLDLFGTHATGDVGELRALVNITELRLGSTQVTGDVGKLERLGKLKVLALDDTQVTGDVGELRVLGDLTKLWLSNTQVGGDVGALQPLVKLTVLALAGTQVTGDVGELRVLGDLTKLWLSNTQVGGDVGALQPLVKLTVLVLSETRVAGDVGKLHALVNITALGLAGTQVTGNVSKLRKALVNLRIDDIDEARATCCVVS